MADEPEFGDVVVVTEGPDEGLIGFYDDDEHEDGVDWMVIYPSTPHATGYQMVFPDYVRKATEAEAEEWKRQHTNEFTTRRNWEERKKQIRNEG